MAACEVCGTDHDKAFLVRAAEADVTAVTHRG